MLFSAIVGGAITGVVSWIKFSNALVALRVEVSGIESRCEDCRCVFRGEIAELREHSIGKMAIDSLEARLAEIHDRLTSIEEALRISPMGRRKSTA